MATPIHRTSLGAARLMWIGDGANEVSFLLKSHLHLVIVFDMLTGYSPHPQMSNHLRLLINLHLVPRKEMVRSVILGTILNT